MYVYYNPNPRHKKSIGDCSVRALAKALNTSWESAYIDLITIGYNIGDMPSSNATIAKLLHEKGFRKAIIPNDCRDCYSVLDFSEKNPKGKFILGTGSHLVTVVDGKYYDTWDSGDEIPICVWFKNEAPNF